MARPKGSPKLGGRKKGAPNKLTADLKAMILGALADQPGGGRAYLARQAVLNPSAFLPLVGRVLPLTLGAGASVTVVAVAGDEAL